MAKGVEQPLWKSVITEIRKTVFLVDLERRKIENEEAKGKTGSSPSFILIAEEMGEIYSRGVCLLLESLVSSALGDNMESVKINLIFIAQKHPYWKKEIGRTIAIILSRKK